VSCSKRLEPGASAMGSLRSATCPRLHSSMQRATRASTSDSIHCSTICIGRHALRRPEWEGRLKLFNVYFLRGAEYRRAIRLVGVAEGTFDYWYGEVKRAVGAEFSRTGLFPPARYFRSRGLTANDRPASPAAAIARADEQVPQQGNAHSEGHPQDVLQEG